MDPRKNIPLDKNRMMHGGHPGMGRQGSRHVCYYNITKGLTEVGRY